MHMVSDVTKVNEIKIRFLKQMIVRIGIASKRRFMIPYKDSFSIEKEATLSEYLTLVTP